MLDIIRLYDSKTKKAVARGILEALPEWFGIAEARGIHCTKRRRAILVRL